MRHLAVLSLLPLVLLLVSCIDGEEEIWLKRDGSGRLEATYKMPGAIMKRFGSAPELQRSLEEAIAKEPSIQISHIGHHVEDGRVVFEFGAKFDDIRTLAAFPKKHLRDPATPDTPGSEEALFGTMDLRVKGLTLIFEREINLAPVLPESALKNPGMLGDSVFRYTVHVPAKANRHNATSIADEGRTLHWEFPLRKYTRAPMSLIMKAPLPMPWWVWFSGFLIGLLFLLLLIWAVKFTMARKK